MRAHLNAAVCLAAILVCGHAAAQTSPEPVAAPPADEDQSVADIVVTAQRRSESMQKVPIAITAISGAQLRAANITTSYDLVAATPALTINRSAVYAVPFLRGIGSPNIVLGDEPSVASYVDGFYQGPAASANLPFNNIERVEVLKGPQGTLYGRNATGGLINLITSQPLDHFAANASVGYGNYETVEAEGYLTGPISSQVRADLSVRYRDQGKGYVENLFNGHHIGKEDVFAARGKVVMDLGEKASLTLAGDYNNSRDNRGTSQSNQPGIVPVGAAPGLNGLFSAIPRKTYLNLDSIGSVKVWGVSATLKADLGTVAFASLTQYRHYHSENVLDADATSTDNVPAQIFPGAGRQNPAFYFDSPTDMPYFVTQELQLLSNTDSPFSWIVGGFAQLSEERYIPIQYRTSANFAIPEFLTIFAQGKTRALSTFGQATYDVGGGVKLTAGGRMTWERKAVTGDQFTGAYNPITSVPSATQDKSHRWSAFTYRLAANWQAIDQLMLYATASKGFKSGTYNTNTVSPTSPPVDPEKLYAYEVGFKSDLTTGLRINGAAYYYKYKDIQTYAQLGNAAVLLNAAAGELYGAELDATWRPVRNFTINGGLAWEHTEYTSFAGAQVYLPFLALPSGQPNFAAPLTVGQTNFFLDATGRPLVRAPKFTANVGATYDVNFADGSGITANVTGYHNSGYSFDPLQIVNQKSYELVSASLTYRLPGGKYSVMAWSRNLTNETYLESVTSGGRNSRVGYNTPRTFGVTLKARID